MTASKGLTPAQRSMLARLAAQSRWAQVSDRAAATKAARDALAAKWAAAADPKAAKAAHMTRMSLAASRSRARSA
jgi:hypothetical protein